MADIVALARTFCEQYAREFRSYDHKTQLPHDGDGWLDGFRTDESPDKDYLALRDALAGAVPSDVPCFATTPEAVKVEEARQTVADWLPAKDHYHGHEMTERHGLVLRCPMVVLDALHDLVGSIPPLTNSGGRGPCPDCTTYAECELECRLAKQGTARGGVSNA